MRIPRSVRDLQVERESLFLDFSSQRLFHGLDLFFGQRRQEFSFRTLQAITPVYRTMDLYRFFSPVSSVLVHFSLFTAHIGRKSLRWTNLQSKSNSWTNLPTPTFRKQIRMANFRPE